MYIKADREQKPLTHTDVSPGYIKGS